MIVCKHCGSTDLEEIREPKGPHYARLVCRACGRMARWLPRPLPSGGPSPEVLALVHPRVRPCPLRGTEKQCRFARSLRETALVRFARWGRPDLVALIKVITDSTWFVANKGRRMYLIRWPEVDQVEGSSLLRPGRCPVCGEPTYEAPACSDECLDEIRARGLGSG